MVIKKKHGCLLTLNGNYFVSLGGAFFIMDPVGNLLEVRTTDFWGLALRTWEAKKEPIPAYLEETAKAHAEAILACLKEGKDPNVVLRQEVLSK